MKCCEASAALPLGPRLYPREFAMPPRDLHILIREQAILLLFFQCQWTHDSRWRAQDQ